MPPRQPEGQEQVFGPTHFPLFMHMGSHTPEHKHTGFQCASIGHRIQTGYQYKLCLTA